MERDNNITSNNLQIVFEVFFFLLFENIVDSPLNERQNTTGIAVKKRELPTLQTKSNMTFCIKHLSIE